MPSKVIIIVRQFTFLGINIFWALLRAHFNPCLTAGAKMSGAQTMFMPANMNSIVIFFIGSYSHHVATFSAHKHPRVCNSKFFRRRPP